MSFNPSISSGLSASLSGSSGLQQDGKLVSLERQLKSRETPEELKKVAKQFESVFMQQVFNALDKTVDRSNSLVSGGPGEDNFREMLYENIASDMNKSPSGSGMGLADAIYRQLIVNMPAESTKAIL